MKKESMKITPFSSLYRNHAIDTVQALSVLTKGSVWYEMRVLWAIINHIKSHAMALAFILPTDLNQIFQMRYFNAFNVNL